MLKKADSRQAKTRLMTLFAYVPAVFILLLASNALASLFGDAPEPLPVEEAFIPSVSGIEDSSLVFEFDIADGYYLYRDKLKLSSDDANFSSLDLPPARAYEDEYFGTSYVYREGVESRAIVNSVNQEQLSVTLHFQGCADIGICYPPTVREFTVDASDYLLKTSTNVQSDKELTGAIPSLRNQLPIKELLLNNSAKVNSDPAYSDPILPKVSSDETSSSSAVIGSTASSLKEFLNQSEDGYNDPPLLHPSEAFVPVVETRGGNQVSVTWNAEEGYYLYRDKLGFELADVDDATVVVQELDEGKLQYDEFYGEVSILRNAANALLIIESATPINTATLNLYYQGCADIGVCFPPEKVVVPVTFNQSDVLAASAGTSGTGNGGTGSGLDVNGSIGEGSATNTISSAAGSVALATVANSSTANAVNIANNAPPVSEQDKLTNLLSGGSWWVITLTFYAAGLLLAFTACVYPMIPILSSLIVGQGDKITTTKAFSLSLVYVLSMASVYAVVGVLVGLSGFNIQPLFQNPWVLSAFAALFVLLALSMFGMFQLQMPAAIQNRLVSMSNNQKGGSWMGVSAMGMLSALIVGPCVTAPLVAALAYIAKTGDAALGGIALFAIGMGMGTPLLLIGTSAGKLLPRAGGWMHFIQRIFGLILLGVAIAMLDRFLPPNVIMLLAAALGIFAAVMLGATDTTSKDSSGMQLFGKSAGLIAGLYGAVLMIGALSGGNSFFKPLAHFAVANGAPTSAQPEHITFERIKSTDDLQNVLVRANQTGQPVLLDFYADWCVSCKEMEKYTFTDERVIDALKNVIVIQADVTANDEHDKALLKKYGLFGPPAILLYNPSTGEEIEAARVVGFLKAEKFNQHLRAYLTPAQGA